MKQHLSKIIQINLIESWVCLSSSLTHSLNLCKQTLQERSNKSKSQLESNQTMTVSLTFSQTSSKVWKVHRAILLKKICFLKAKRHLSNSVLEVYQCLLTLILLLKKTIRSLMKLINLLQNYRKSILILSISLKLWCLLLELT